ncbi:unnamed protein product [Victoria cruziana]
MARGFLRDWHMISLENAQWQGFVGWSITADGFAAEEYFDQAAVKVMGFASWLECVAINHTVVQWCGLRVSWESLQQHELRISSNMGCWVMGGGRTCRQNSWLLTMHMVVELHDFRVVWVQGERCPVVIERFGDVVDAFMEGSTQVQEVEINFECNCLRQLNNCFFLFMVVY